MKQSLEDKITKLCKQLYTIGVNDGKIKCVYFPRPFVFYAGKIIEAIEKSMQKSAKKTKPMQDPKGDAFIEFMEGQGLKFIDTTNISQCPHCLTMTKTVKRRCGKCKYLKESKIDE